MTSDPGCEEHPTHEIVVYGELEVDGELYVTETKIVTSQQAQVVRDRIENAMRKAYSPKKSYATVRAHDPRSDEAKPAAPADKREGWWAAITGNMFGGGTGE